MEAAMDMNILIVDLSLNPEFKWFRQKENLQIFSPEEELLNIENHNPESSLNFTNGSSWIFKKENCDIKNLQHQRTFKNTSHKRLQSLRWCWCDYLGDDDNDGRAWDGGEGWMSNQAELGLEWIEVAKGDF